MYQLVIAEKPSLARKIKECLAKRKHISFTKHDGYDESETVVVTSVFGHLLTVADLVDYDPSWKSWTDSYPNLPFTLDVFKDMKFKLSANDGVKQRYKLIVSLMKNANCIVHAGDADREGEVIVRNILRASKYKGQVMRLWLPAQDIDTIEEAWDSMKDDKEYNNLAAEGYARTAVDSLYGFNLTRYVTCVGGDLYKIGSVKVPIVEAIYDREMEIRNFVPETYYALQHTGTKDNIPYTLNYNKKFKNKDDAQTYADTLNLHDLVVTNVKKEKSVLKPKHLFSLTTLQNAMAKRYKYSNDETLTALQTLYEAGYVTYPRTDTEFMAESEMGTVKQVIATLGDDNLVCKNTKSIFDSSKVEAHSAVIPTRQTVDPNEIKDVKQRHVYETVLNRFKANFWKDDCVIAKTSIVFTTTDGIDDVQLTLSGKTLVEPGWTTVDVYESKDVIVPNFNKGDIEKPNFKAEEKQTKPKPHYTVESLNNFLESPFKDEMAENKSDSEYTALLEGLSIGTVATRAGIIKQLIDAEYISLTKVTYGITPRGESMIKAIRDNDIPLSKEKTIVLGGWLKDVYQGTKSINDVLALVSKELHEICDTSKPIAQRKSAKSANIICKCPKCGGDVIKGKRKSDGATLYFCSNFRNEDESKKCSFIMGNPMKYFDNEVELTDAKVKSLCAGKDISAKVTTMKGTTRTAKLKLAFNGKYTNLAEDKAETSNAEPKKAICECPRCHSGKVYKSPNRNIYYCENTKDDSCTFKMFVPMKFFANKVDLTEQDVIDLCEGRYIVRSVKGKNGKVYKSKLKLAFNGIYTNLASFNDGTDY